MFDKNYFMQIKNNVALENPSVGNWKPTVLATGNPRRLPGVSER